MVDFNILNAAIDAGNTAMRFGKYKGKTLAEILRIDRGYLKWVRDSSDCASRFPFIHDQVKAVLAAGVVPIDPSPLVTDDAELRAVKGELSRAKAESLRLTCEVAQLRRDAKDVDQLRREVKELEESLFALRRKQAVNGTPVASSVWKDNFRRLAMLSHPDRGGSTELMALVNEINGKMK